MRLKLAIYFLKAVRCISLKMCLSACCRSATVVATAFGLFFLKGLLRYETTPTEFVQLENLDTQSMRLKDSLTVAAHTVALTSGSPISSSQDGISFSHRNEGPLNQLDFISSSAFKPLELGVICWIVLGINVSPFFCFGVRPDYLYSVGNYKHYLGITPKVLFQISVS